MDASMEGLLETYLFETNSLLDGLDELLINAEKVGDFSEDDVTKFSAVCTRLKVLLQCLSLIVLWKLHII